MLQTETKPPLEVPGDTKFILNRGVSKLTDDYTIRFNRSSIFLDAITDSAGILFVLGAGALELGDPVVSSAVEKHSRYHGDTWGRIERSAHQVAMVAISDDALVAGRRIAQIHDKLGIKGLNAEGVEVPATDPQAFARAYLPITLTPHQVLMRRGAPQRELEEWYDQSRIVFQCTGVEDTFLPKSYEEYLQAVQDMYDSVTYTESIKRVTTNGIDSFKIYPNFAWRGPLKWLGDRGCLMLMRGSLPENVLATYRLEPLSTRERLVYEAACIAIMAWSKHAPVYLTHHPYAAKHMKPPETALDRGYLRASCLATTAFTGLSHE